MPAEGRVVVCLCFPLVTADPWVGRLEALDPRIEAIAVPYLEEEARRRARHRLPLDELRATAPPLGAGLREVLARAEVILSFDLPVDAAAAAPRLRWVHSISAGIEHFTGSGLRSRGIVVTNASGVASRSIAEFVAGRLLMIWKRFGEQLDHQREKRWVAAYGRTFAGSTVGVIGVGAIGGAVARLLHGLGATVLGVRRSGAPAPCVEEMYAPARLHEMLRRCDAVVIAAPASADTHHLFDRAALAAMRPGAVLCNVARGSLVDEEALVDGLRTGHVGAAALDVFAEEPLPPESPLWSLPNVFVSAHCAVSIDRYVDDLMEHFVANLRRWLAGEPLENVIEPPD